VREKVLPELRPPPTAAVQDLARPVAAGRGELERELLAAERRAERVRRAELGTGRGRGAERRVDALDDARVRHRVRERGDRRVERVLAAAERVVHVLRPARAVRAAHAREPAPARARARA
jgi:hypothetical protein